MVRNRDFAAPPPTAKVSPRFLMMPAKSKTVRFTAQGVVEKYGANCFFNPFGPIGRFCHHPRGRPKIHEYFGICYLADNITTAIAELFLDPQEINPDYFFFVLETAKDLKLLDLTGDGPILAGTLTDVTTYAVDYEQSREWSTYFYTEYPDIDGLIWDGAQNGGLCYSLYERAGDCLKVVKQTHVTKLRNEIMKIAIPYQITVNF